MTRALLYHPGQRRRGAVAFAVAALIHVAAVGLAGIQHKQIDDGQAIETGPPEITIESTSPVDNSTPPPDLDTPPPSLNRTDELFTEPASSPRPVLKQVVKSTTPLTRERSGNPGPSTLSTAKVFALNAPRPEYPYEARRQRVTGDGIVAMTIDPRDGSVTDVAIWKSTGSPYLDDAATAAFRKWRFKPGTVLKVRAPITFTLMGASY